MKKIILTTIFTTNIVFAADYVIRVDENANYVLSSSPDEIITSDWIDMGITYDCVNTIDTNNYYKDIEFTQTEECSQDQTRTITSKKDGIVLSEVVENQTVLRTEDIVNYGTHVENNCNNALQFDNTLSSGVYEIYYNNKSYNVYCNMTDDDGGWTLVYKKNKGVSNDPRDLWDSTISSYDNLNYTNESIISNKNYSSLDYTNDIRKDISNFSDVRLEVNKDGSTQKFIKFTTSSDYQDFIHQNKITESSWTDITYETSNFFSVDGDYNIQRYFYMNSAYGGCHIDIGWFSALGELRETTCNWETFTGDYGIIYSPLTTKSTFQTAGQYEHADNFMIYYR